MHCSVFPVSVEQQEEDWLFHSDGTVPRQRSSAGRSWLGRWELVKGCRGERCWQLYNVGRKAASPSVRKLTRRWRFQLMYECLLLDKDSLQPGVVVCSLSYTACSWMTARRARTVNIQHSVYGRPSVLGGGLSSADAPCRAAADRRVPVSRIIVSSS